VLCCCFPITDFEGPSRLNLSELTKLTSLGFSLRGYVLRSPDSFRQFCDSRAIPAELSVEPRCTLQHLCLDLEVTLHPQIIIAADLHLLPLFQLLQAFLVLHWCYLRSGAQLV
jgi:hypothetical protein